ncbi:hypothetical protein [Halocalculus aciditolerans]|uniref:Uncharacterized protein n=1 Tax=Halocalculus aciditolerans TaxID=1383812 RepID=A0A830F6L1_9EURY|nr:hypothetical protein [Halocalculus aciditolerans]GGL68433.1 hypothetical protein GCM10009039_28080 [Halocalculus aciditolerans]
MTSDSPDELSVEEHLRRALRKNDSEPVERHIRQALQYRLYDDELTEG